MKVAQELAPPDGLEGSPDPTLDALAWYAVARPKITVNPRQGEEADVGSVGADDIDMPGKILIRAEGDSGWSSPAP